MKLETAIDTATEILLISEPDDPPITYPAIKLLIEAGKAILHSRTQHGGSLFIPLPGETKE